MIDFWLNKFVWALRLLDQEGRDAFGWAQLSPDSTVDPSGPNRDRLVNNLKFIANQCEALVLTSACDRIVRITHALNHDRGYTFVRLANDLKVLNENIYDDARYEEFYHYPREKSRLWKMITNDWSAALSKFPSTKTEIEAGIDCYALCHNTASVFHMMRVAEIGMRALARERQVSFPKHPLEWADWQNILDLTEKNARTATTGMSRGPAKDAGAAFYSGAIAQLHGFKDTFRNVVMHVRRSYDELDALRAINQVRDFMNGLSTKIGETTKRPIGRWP